MAESIKRGSGMLERDAVRLETNDLRRTVKTKISVEERRAGKGGGLDAVRESKADACRAILAAAGVDQDSMDPADCFSDSSAHVLAAAWLDAYRRLGNARERFASDPTPRALEYVVEFAEELGRLQERLWWRAGVDRSTGVRREELALSGRAYKRASDLGSERRRGQFGPETAPVLAAMHRFVDAGQTVANAARLAWESGCGVSTDANRKLWYRRTKKAVTHP